MNLSLKIALRYFKSTRSSKLINLISLFSIGGIAVGVMAMVVVLSVMDGFEEELKKRLERGDIHLLVESKGEEYFDFSREMEQKIFSLGDSIRQLQPILQTEAIVRSGNKVQGLVLKGVGDSQFFQIQENLIEGTDGKRPVGLGSSETPIYLGQELAYSLSVFPGEELLLISPIETEGPLDSVPRIKKVYVAGFLKTGISEKDATTAWLPINAVRSFMRVRSGINRLEVRLSAVEFSEELAPKLQEYLGPGFSVHHWKDLNAHLFSSLVLERISMFVILLFIVMVASFNIVTTISLTILEKKKEIGILKALGADTSMVSRIFLYKGLVTGSIGVLLGVLFGVSICFLLKAGHWIELPDIYYDRNLPAKVTPLYVAFISFMALLITLVASVIPTLRARKMSIVAGLKF